MVITELSIAVVPVDQAEPFCRTARLLVAMLLGDRVSLLCRGIFELVFAFAGVCSRQYAIRLQPNDRTFLLVNVMEPHGTLRMPPPPAPGGFLNATSNLVPGVGIVTFYSPISYADVTEEVMVDIGQGLSATPGVMRKYELLFERQKEHAALLFVLEASVYVTGRPIHGAYGHIVWNEQSVRRVAGRDWALLGLFDETAHARLRHPTKEDQETLNYGAQRTAV